jgi:acyl carrier protein phosphodiesterase
MGDPIKNTVEYGRELFAHLEEFFLRVTGKTATEFATVESFGDVIRSSASEIAPRCEAAFRWLDTEVRAFHAHRGIDAFTDAMQLGGMNLVLGSGSQFRQNELNSVSTAVLFSDTVLIPDPVMPWLERDRTEERFHLVLPLEAVHSLLQLKPFVDADLPYPPVAVFPSWEKLLEEHDGQTQQGILQILTDVLADSLGEGLASFEEAVDFADRHTERFCETVERNHLFVAPRGPVTEPLKEALARYEGEMATWRSDDWLGAYSHLPIHHQILNGIMERVAPVYHLLENAQELNGHPLMYAEQQAHYFKLVSHASSGHLAKLDLLNPRTMALVNTLSSRRLRWLGDIPIDTLVNLRRDNENVTFRERLAASVGKLHGSALHDLDRVAAEVCHDLEGAIANHEKELRSIQEKYSRIHGQTAVLGIAAGAALIPALAPLLSGVAPFALAAKYAHDKVAELAQKRALTQSVVGVLAAAKPEH